MPDSVVGQVPDWRKNELVTNSDIAVHVHIDLNGIRGFKILTSDKKSIPDNNRWIRKLWVHLNRFEDEQREYISDLVEGVIERSDNAG